MISKICLIYQPCGLGDILFCQKIAHYYHSLGYDIVWPVIYEYAWLSEYIPWIQWVSWGDKGAFLTHMDKLPDTIRFPKKEFYNPYSECIFSDEFVYINGFLSHSGPIMAFKYQSARLDWRDWRDYVIYTPNKKAEEQLFEKLGLKIGEEYVFVNRNYQIRPHPFCLQSVPNNFAGRKVVELSILDGFSIFDWIPVICGAAEIHMVETSLNYILESPQVAPRIQANKMCLYSRFNSFHEVSYLFNLPWSYIHT